MKYRLRKFPLIRLLLLYFIAVLSENVHFTENIFNMHIISMGLSCLYMYAEACLESSQTSMVELLSRNHKKALLHIFDWALNTPLS